MTFNKEQWKAQIKTDFPGLHDYFIDMIIETYKTDPEWFQKEVGRLKKSQQNKSKNEVRKPGITYTDLPGNVVLMNELPEFLLPQQNSDVIVNEIDQESNVICEE